MLSEHLGPSNQKSDQNNNSSQVASFSFIAGIYLFASSNPTISSMNTWIIDSGAYRHSYSYANAFISLQTIQILLLICQIIYICLPIHLCGDVKLGLCWVLKDVLFVPQFRFNLLSVSAFTTNSFLIVNFSSDSVLIQDPNKRMIGKGDKVDGMYVLDVSKLGLQSTLPNNVQVFVNKVSAHTWHNRLGHLSNKILDLLRHHVYHLDPLIICPRVHLI